MMEKKHWYLNAQDQENLQRGREQTLIWNALRTVMAIQDIPPILLEEEGERWLENIITLAQHYKVMDAYRLPIWIEISHRGGELFWQLDDVQEVLNNEDIDSVRLNTLLQMARLEQRNTVKQTPTVLDVTNSTIYHWCEARLPLWAIIDGALDAAPQGFASGLDVAHYSLFNAADRALESHGPWLIAAWAKPRMVQYLLSRPNYAFNTLWLVADGDANDLVTHLQGLLYVKQHDDQNSRFRFHDPRVFSHWLNTLDSLRLADFFGLVQRWISPDPNPLWSDQRLHCYSLIDDALEHQALMMYPPNKEATA
ncbi:DUF4123 domain-containing protein [Hafnia alvei]|uniref:DUF4123 domain-containing protein n=1 Tax=Hafnia alvei TaxID=569 RepID=UPI00141257BB|nr:DUF4123 domain-containing protein [Hafnia alvei]QIP57010.1 DUF4123 domain-containing protein [Hafnia alvei]